MNISRSRSRSVNTAPFTRATGLSLTCIDDDVVADADPVFVITLGACDATWAVAAVSVDASIPQIRSWYFINPRFKSRKTGGEKLSPPDSDHASVYWNWVVMLLVLLASFASPKWH